MGEKANINDLEREVVGRSQESPEKEKAKWDVSEKSGSR